MTLTRTFEPWLLPDEEFPITPAHIDATDHLWNAFGNCETEVSARWIVRFCQERGSWAPFAYKALDTFYKRGIREKGERLADLADFRFNRLADDRDDKGGLVVEKDGLYHVTAEFVTRCYLSRPARKTTR